MREIKFRGKRIDGKGWVYGFYVFSPDGKHRIYWKPFDGATSNIYREVTPETVGQYTGLKDKNGTDIYGNQDVKGMNGAGRVVYSDERAMWIVNDGYNEPLFHHNGRIEVI
jgi:hypothetical protein